MEDEEQSSDEEKGPAEPVAFQRPEFVLVFIHIWGDSQTVSRKCDEGQQGRPYPYW